MSTDHAFGLQRLRITHTDRDGRVHYGLPRGWATTGMMGEWREVWFTHRAWAFPRLSLFPRTEKALDRLALTRSRIRGAWAILRHGGDWE